MNESTSQRVVFSLGSNLGDRLGYLQSATTALRLTPGIRVVAISPVYQTSPMGPVEQPDFFNIVVLAESELPATALLEQALAIEDALERVRTVRWGPRTVDIDLVAAGDQVIDSARLTLPHPRAHERAFVLVPWLAVDADAALPGHGPVAELAAAAAATGVQRRDDVQVR